MSVHDEVLIDAILAKPGVRPIARFSFPRWHTAKKRNPWDKPACLGDSKPYKEYLKHLKAWLKAGYAVHYAEEGSHYEIVAHVEVWP